MRTRNHPNGNIRRTKPRTRGGRQAAAAQLAGARAGHFARGGEQRGREHKAALVFSTRNKREREEIEGLNKTAGKVVASCLSKPRRVFASTSSAICGPKKRS